MAHEAEAQDNPGRYEQRPAERGIQPRQDQQGCAEQQKPGADFADPAHGEIRMAAEKGEGQGQEHGVGNQECNQVEPMDDAGDHQGDRHRDQGKPVSKGVHDPAQFGRLVEAACDIAVDPVGARHDGQDNHGDAVFLLREYQPDEERHAHEAQHRQGVGDGEDAVVVDLGAVGTRTSADEPHSAPLLLKHSVNVELKQSVDVAVSYGLRSSRRSNTTKIVAEAARAARGFQRTLGTFRGLRQRGELLAGSGRALFQNGFALSELFLGGANQEADLGFDVQLGVQFVPDLRDVPPPLFQPAVKLGLGRVREFHLLRFGFGFLLRLGLRRGLILGGLCGLRLGARWIKQGSVEARAFLGDPQIVFDAPDSLFRHQGHGLLKFAHADQAPR